MNDLLLYEIKELQNNYRNILKEAADNIFKRDTAAILDEINVFWIKNKKLVHCALEYLSKPYQTYVFTAATVLDVDDYEHYPFLCLGDFHIWDDPIYGYIRMGMESQNEKFNEEVKNQIYDTINENIKILDSINDKILIFPIRMISDVSRETIHNAAEQAFLSLFKKPPTTMKEYLQTFSTIEEVDSALRSDIKNTITLSENDSKFVEIKERFNYYKSNISLPLPAETSNAYIFMFAVYGFLSQALDIIMTCSAYRFVPYIRYNVSFQYVLILTGSFPNNPEFKSWLFKFIVSHILHKSFDKEKYSKVEFNKFVQIIKERKFEKKLFEDLKRHGISTEYPSIAKTVEIINNQFNDCFPNLA